MTSSDIAALALCQLDPRWDSLNETQRAIWLKNSRSGKAFRAAKRAAEIAFSERVEATQTPSPQTVHAALRFAQQVANHHLGSPDCSIACLEELVGQARSIEAMIERDSRSTSARESTAGNQS